VFALYAAGVALFSGPGLDRWWGIWAVGGYAAAAAAAWCWRSRRGRLAALAASLAGALAAPVVWLATRAPATPDVTVVTRSAALLLHHATPYLPPAQLARGGVLAYNPYLPVMTIFGMPRALGLPGLLGDPRPWLAAATFLLLAVAFRAAAQPAPMRRAVFATASPIMAFPIALGITDPPVLALTCLGLALLIRPVRSLAALARPARVVVHPAWLAAATIGVACAMKYTAWPALVVLTAMVAARDSARAAARFAAIAVATTLALAAALAPASLSSPGGLVQNTIFFPLGLTHARSPAQSPLPGHLLATIGSAGRLAAIILLITAGVAIGISLVVRAPRDTTAAARRLALGLTLLFALSPATRFGYFAYPLGLLGWIALSRTPRNSDRSLSISACGPPAPRGRRAAGSPARGRALSRARRRACGAMRFRIAPRAPPGLPGTP
jgi:phosphatidylinositol alpha-1,6-mannosyltransferase